MCTASAIRKVLARKGLMSDSRLCRQQNDERSANAEVIPLRLRSPAAFSIRFAVAGRMPCRLRRKFAAEIEQDNEIRNEMGTPSQAGIFSLATTRGGHS
jgi:hypothetical protein